MDSAPSPLPFDPSKPSLPLSYPIKNLKDLESKSYFKSFHYPFNVASIPLPSSSGLANRPRILVCHDMKGGYTEDDKWVQGGSNGGAYAIWHWHLMDVFVYFSHNLVTIPPPGWINSAHIHGVQVLGTFITESSEGKAILKQVLSTKESAHMYADLLAELAVSLGFDGWLLNIEVSVGARRIPNMKEFVSRLTQKMHSSKPGSLVIWYDSVTINGYIGYQNQLNDKNKPFFDLCDGIFLNYWWEENYPKMSATVAGQRKFDVYFGIDIFGRGTFGGGKWSTNVALDVLKKDDVSAAIFAPGWVYENNEPPDFQTAQNRWWKLVEESWGILQSYPNMLPFYSNFDQGHGYRFSVDGRQVSNNSWCNMSCQTFQPVLGDSNPSTDNIQVIVDFKGVSYNGGGNITAKGTLEGTANFTRSIFQGKLPLQEKLIHVTFSLKLDGSSKLGLSFLFVSKSGEKKSVLIGSAGDALLTMNQLASKFDQVIMANSDTKLEREAEGGSTKLGGWVVQKGSISMKEHTLTEIQMVCYKLQQDPKPEFSASLGHLTIKTSDQNFIFPPTSSWEVKSENMSWTQSNSEGSKSLSLKIMWKLKNEHDSLTFPKYNIYASKMGKQKIVEAKEYIGVAQVSSFYVSDMVVPAGISSVKFIIQVCATDGTSQKLDSSPELVLNVPS